MIKYNLSEFHQNITGKTFGSSNLYDVLKASMLYGSIGNGGVWLAGGALRRTVIGQPLDSDLDVFFKNATAFKDLRYYYEQVVGLEPKDKQNNVTFNVNGYKVQLIHNRYWETPEQVIDDFDFTNCQLITDLDSVWVGDYTMYDIARMRLRIHKIVNPITSTRRLIKYCKQGFYACDGTLTEMFEVVRKLDTLPVPMYVD